jgi:hypothetical protein
VTEYRLRFADDTLDAMIALLEHLEIAAQVLGFPGVTVVDLKRKTRLQDAESE